MLVAVNVGYRAAKWVDEGQLRVQGVWKRVDLIG
jgi:hypothetical protein